MKRLNCHRIALAFACVTCLSAVMFANENRSSDERLVLANDHVRFEFEPGTMGLAKMVDLRTGYNHIRDVDGRHLLWEVAFGVGRQIYTITNNYGPCTNAFVEELADGTRRAVMEWKDLRW